jgi:(R,R)-butanediol dehydrogenase/meso-butanediol dehydrogenase/diacetyl reductase
MSQTMTAAVFKGRGQLAVEDVPVPELEGPDDVILRVEAASVCGTDVHILDVPPGHPATEGAILGHEFVGEVVSYGEAVEHLQQGDKVVVAPNISCGTCVYCRKNKANLCTNMTTLGIFIDGGFAEYCRTPASALHPYSRDLPPDKAVLAEPLSCVVNAVKKVDVVPGQSVLILGAGPIGQLFIDALKANGAGSIVVSEPNALRADVARKVAGVRVANPNEEDLAKVLANAADGGADLVVDAVGSLFGVALEHVNPGGTVLLFGMNETARREVGQYWITRKEIRVLGTFISGGSFPETVKLLESGLLDVERLVTHRIGVREIPDGIELMRRGDAIKIVVTP